MSRESLLILLGVLIFLAPFSGLPFSWLSWILSLLGIIVGIVGFSLRAKRASPPPALLHEEPPPPSAF